MSSETGQPPLPSGASISAMGLAFALSSPGERGSAVLVAWLIAHFVWSFVFASWILTGGAVTERDVP